MYSIRIFPEFWKYRYAVVTPIQKSKDNIELRFQFYQCFLRFWSELLMINWFSSILKFNLSSDRQSGFCLQHST